jgi:TolA-binding protein
MINQHDIELIEKYFNHQLSERERSAFESRLDQDNILAAELDKHRSAHKMLDYLVAKNLKAELVTLEQEEKVVSIHAHRRRKKLFALSIAASVLLIFGFFFTDIFTKNISPSSMAMAYYELPESAERSGTEASLYPENIQLGLQAFTNKNYLEAIQLLEAVPESDAYYVLAQYYLGHAHFESDNFAGAQATFDRVSKTNDVRYQEEASWFALLACLAQDQSCSSALRLLTEDTTHSFHTEALEIQQKLK